MFQAPVPLRKARHLFDCVSFTVYRSPYCHTVLNADGRVHTVICVRLFYLFPHICASLFFSPSSGSFLFFFFFFFSSQFSSIPIFTRTSFIPFYSHIYAHLFYPILFPYLRAPLLSHFIPIFTRTSFIFYLLSPSTLFFYKLLRTRLSPCLFQFSLVSIFAQRQASYNSYTSLLPHSSCDHAYYVHFGMVSS